MSKTNLYSTPTGKKNFIFSPWDALVLILILSIIAILTYGALNMVGPYQLGQPIAISLSPYNLPKYATMTALRMIIALILSLIFTFTVGTLAAKSRHAENFIIPFVDIMQSVPVIGIVSISALAFVRIFPGSTIGLECAAIFAIFTSQVWNMVLSFYQSLKNVPKELKEAATIFQLNAWQKFWRMEVPFALPGLLWTTMVSMSAGWLCVVASEAIPVLPNDTVCRQGIGSYISVAMLHADNMALFYAFITMIIVIFIYDQLLFRPLIAWSERFRPEPSEDDTSTDAWFLDLAQRTKIGHKIAELFAIVSDSLLSTNRKSFYQTIIIEKIADKVPSKALIILWYIILFGFTTIIVLKYLYPLLHDTVTLKKFLYVSFLSCITLVKIFVLIILSSLFWVPIGVWIGSKPKLTKLAQPIIQFLAAFPAELVYPIFAICILKFNLNQEIWTTPLMILGTQWYILFNVIAGASTISSELRLVAENFNVRGILWWKRIILPSIFPYYITGAMAAAGGCWNASIIADRISWGEHTFKASGIGGFIKDAVDAQAFADIALGISVMCIFVLLMNRLIWKNLYLLVESKYSTQEN